MTGRTEIDPHRLLQAIDVVQVTPDEYTKEEVLKMLGIAAVVIGRQIVSESLAVDAMLAVELEDAEPEGRA